jgi:hypothetical protein
MVLRVMMGLFSWSHQDCPHPALVHPSLQMLSVRRGSNWSRKREERTGEERDKQDCMVLMKWTRLGKNTWNAVFWLEVVEHSNSTSPTPCL